MSGEGRGGVHVYLDTATHQLQRVLCDSKSQPSASRTAARFIMKALVLLNENTD